MIRPALTTLAILLIGTLGPTGTASAQWEAGPGVSPGFADRLESLRPDDPEGYLRLGEEVLVLASGEDGRALARRLFALAYELARVDRRSPAVQASACIALADTARFERDRRWLWSIVRLIDPRYSEPDWSRTVEREVSRESAFRAATTLGLLRAGEGVRAREMLRDPAVRDVFGWYSGLLTDAGPGDVLSVLDAEAERWPCPECRNARAVRTPQGGEVALARCFTCQGNPGWALSPRAFLATLRFESRVLAGVQRSWGAQLAADLGEPLRDPDPALVTAAIGIDPRLSVYRDGRWVDPGDAP